MKKDHVLFLDYYANDIVSEQLYQLVLLLDLISPCTTCKNSPPAFINVESSFILIPYYTSFNTTQVKVYVNQAF